MEYTQIEFTTDKWNAIKEYLQLTPDVDYTLKRIRIKDSLFDNDETYKQLKKEADRAYKYFNDYQYDKRHGIK